MTVVLCYSSNKKLINLLLLFLLEHVHPLKASWLPFLPEYQELSNLHVLLWLGHSSTQTPGTSSVPGGLHDMTGWPDWFDATTFLAMCVAWDTFSGFWGFRGLVLRKDSLFAFLNFTWIPSCEWHRASWMHVCVLLDGFVFSKLVASIYYAAPTRNLGIFLNSLLLDNFVKYFYTYYFIRFIKALQLTLTYSWVVIHEMCDSRLVPHQVHRGKPGLETSGQGEGGEGREVGVARELYLSHWFLSFSSWWCCSWCF